MWCPASARCSPSWSRTSRASSRTRHLTWRAVVEPLEHLNDRLGLACGTVGHLMGVKNSEALRAAHEAVAEVVTFSLRVGQSQPVYRALKEAAAA